MILASWCGKKVVPEKIRQRPGWDAIPAVRNNRLVEIKSPLILQPGPAALTDGIERNLYGARRIKPSSSHEFIRRHHRHRACRRQIEPHGWRRQGAAAAWRDGRCSPMSSSASRRRSRRSCSTPMTIRAASRRLDCRWSRTASHGQMGPLAGIHAGLAWAKANRPGHSFVITVAADTPFFPADLVSRFCAATSMTDPKLVVARSESGVHPVFGLMAGVACASSRGLAPSRRAKGARLRRGAAGEGGGVPARGVRGRAVDPFFNINRPEDLAEAKPC